MTTETTQPLDYETQADRDLDAHFDRERRTVRRQMWAAMVVVGVVGFVWVVL